MSRPVPYPGLLATADGTEVVVWVETHISQGACAYPITPSTGMGTGFQAAQAAGRKNLWGDPLVFLEPESEHSSASACEGFALAGGRVTNFTSGQGLVLMKEVLYTIAGKRLPVVFHVGARALSSQALNVHCGHDDVMAVNDCGWGIVFARNCQEVADLALIARHAAEATETPFLCVQDGFLTTHTVETVRLPEPDLMVEVVGDPGRLRDLLDPARPVMSGVVQNPDAYMKGRIAQRAFARRVGGVLRETMARYAALTGRRYGLVDPYRLEDAEFAFVAMGSLVETAMATADWLRARRRLPVGVLGITVYRPFPAAEVVQALAGVRALTVLERLDNPLAGANPLALEVKAALADALTGRPGYPALAAVPRVHAGAAGLGGRDVRPGDLVAAVEEMARAGRRDFVLGIPHDDALPRTEDPDVRPPGAFSLRWHSIGGSGAGAASRALARVMAELFGLHVQAYPVHGAEKKGLPTTYFLTAAGEHIRLHAEPARVELVAVHDAGAFGAGDPLAGLVTGGTLLVPASGADPDGLWRALPARARQTILDRGLRVLTLDALRAAREGASRPDLAQRRLGMVLLGALLRTIPFAAQRGLGEAVLFQAVERTLEEAFGARGDRVVRDNLEAVRRGYREVREVEAVACA